MIGIIPAAGAACRLQPLGGSKELLPLGDGETGLRAVSEFLLDRMLLAGADRLCLVISPEKADLLRYYARWPLAGRIAFVVQPEPAGLCDAVFRAAPWVGPAEPVLIGLPDTIWHPRDAFRVRSEPPRPERLPAAAAAKGGRAARRAPPTDLRLITFPVAHPEQFDAVIPRHPDRSAGPVARIEIKVPGSPQRRVWGAITASGPTYHALAGFWRARAPRDQYLGHLLNAWIEAGHAVTCDPAGAYYCDIGTPEGYEQAWRDRAWRPPATSAAA